MNRILDTLRSPGAMMIALVLALFPQGEHTAQVFMRFSHEAGDGAQGFAYAFAAAVEVAVLLFVMAGHRRISFAFAGASFLTNIVYYAIGGVALLSVQVLPAILLSALLPACIMGYSHTIAAKTTQTPVAAVQRSAKQAHERQGWWRRWQWWHKRAEMPVETPTLKVRSTTTNITDSEEPAANVPASEGDSAPPKLTKAQRQAHIREQEITDAAAIAAQFRVSLRTAQMDLADVREGVTQTNGKGAH